MLNLYTYCNDRTKSSIVFLDISSSIIFFIAYLTFLTLKTTCIILMINLIALINFPQTEKVSIYIGIKLITKFS